MVGTAEKNVGLARSTVAQQVAASNRSAMNVEPPARSGDTTLTMIPLTWKSGRMSIERVSSVMGSDAPLGQSLQSVFKTFGVTQALFAKMQYSCPEKYGSVIAPWFNQINTFLFGGVTQHGEFVGNVCADLNGMGGGGLLSRPGSPHWRHSWRPSRRHGRRNGKVREPPAGQPGCAAVRAGARDLVRCRGLRPGQAAGRRRGAVGLPGRTRLVRRQTAGHVRF